MKKILVSAIINLLVFGAVKAESINPALKIWKNYEPEAGRSYDVNPYINNIIAIDLLEKDRDVDDVKDYILWYFQHINYQDKTGITGSMYDYNITSKGVETHKELYDSVDGYAGTFLILLNNYYRKTKDEGLLKENWKKINDVAYLIAYLQDKDGLIKALPKEDAKYLMDNCECYGGLSAYIEMSGALGEKNTYYKLVRESVKNGIMSELFNEKENFFYWGIRGKVKCSVDKGVFYPDSFSQLFVILFGVLDGRSGINDQLLWKTFGSHYEKNTAEMPQEQRIIFNMVLKKMGGNEK